jgi:hypothetical protein
MPAGEESVDAKRIIGRAGFILYSCHQALRHSTAEECGYDLGEKEPIVDVEPPGFCIIHSTAANLKTVHYRTAIVISGRRKDGSGCVVAPLDEEEAFGQAKR